MELIQALERLSAIDAEWDEKARLFQQAREQLADSETPAARRREQQLLQDALAKARGTLRDLELELESLQERLRKAEDDLYSGGISAPRELENLRRDTEYLRRHIGQLEDQALDSMTTVDELQERVDEGQRSLEGFEQDWSEQTADARETYETLRARLRILQAEREQIRADIPRRELALYDELRRTKGGRPLAPMRAGVCQVCRVTVPSHKASIAAGEGNGVATCEGCGRILYQA